MSGMLMNRLFERQTTPEGGEDGGTGEETRPEWLLEKFKSTEEQGRAYAEAERRMTQLQTQLDQERQQFAETIQSVQQTVTPPEPQYDPAQDPIMLQYEKAVNEGDARAMLAINLQIQQRMMEQTLDQRMKPQFEKIEQGMTTGNQADRDVAITLATERVKKDFENWDELAPKIGAVLQERPHWIPQGAATVDAFETTLREVADLITAQDLVKTQNQELAARTAKLNAQGLTGTGSRQPTPEEQQDAWKAVKDVQLGGYSGIIR